MNRKYFIVILILTLLCLFLIFAYFESPVAYRKEKTASVQAPFPSYISGVGVVEPASGNIYIGIPFNRIVQEVKVSVNDKVKKGDILVVLDHHDLTANLKVKEQEHEKALASLQKLKELPQKEDLTIAEEALRKAKITLEEAKAQYEKILNLPSPNAIRGEERDKRQFRYQQAEAEYKEIEARYDKIKSGSWKPDLNIAHYQAEQAKADVDALKVEIERTYIRAPINGTILQMKIHEGEIPGNYSSQPFITIGNVDELNLRVSVDQFNVANVKPDAPAVAFRQGDPSHHYDLKFLYLEPVMIQKKYLTNAIEEQIDTRVFEILYRLKKTDTSVIPAKTVLEPQNGVKEGSPSKGSPVKVDASLDEKELGMAADTKLFVGEQMNVCIEQKK